MELGLLPSQFLSVVLEESDRNGGSAANPKNVEVPRSMSTSVTISPIVPKSVAPPKKRANGKYMPGSIKNGTTKLSNGSIKIDEYWDLKKKLPPTVLEECIVELANSSSRTFSKVSEPKENAVIIKPMYTKKPEKLQISNNKEENFDIRDIFNRVEAVYSDDEEQTVNVGTKINGSYNSNEQPSETQGAMYACDHCPNKYTNKGALWQHNVAAHSIEKSCECQLCGRKFYRNCSLALHMKCHSDEQNCSCKVCGKEFNRLSTLERHAKCHNTETSNASATASFACKICSKKFADDATLRTHILAHNEKFTCEQCNVTFNTKQLLDLHFHITHKRSETPFACKLCKARFPNLRELNEHSTSHTFDKLRISCHHCGEIFTQRCSYKKHLQLHVGERLSCTICRIDFTQRSSLLRHYKRLHLMNDIPNSASVVESSNLTIITK